MSFATLNSRPQLFHCFGSVTGTAVIITSAFGGSSGNGPALFSPLANPLPNGHPGIWACLVTVSAAATITFTDSVPNNLSQGFQLGINGAIALDLADNGDPWFFSGVGGAGLSIASSASVTIGFDIYWQSLL